MAGHPTLDPQKRSRILSAAAQLIRRGGLKGATIARIAERAGVGKGTIYLYYPDRAALIDAVLAQSLEESLAACAAGLDREPTARGKLKRRVHNLLFWQRAHPDLAAVMGLFNESPSVKRNNYALMKGHYEEEQKIIEQGLADGEFLPLPVPMICEMFFSAIGGVVRYVHQFPQILDQPEALDQLLDVTLGGVLKHGQEPAKAVFEIKKEETT